MNISQNGRLRSICTYLTISALGHLIWEVLQLPLYTIWTTDTLQHQAFTVVYCTAGDILIAASSLLVALTLVRAREWPRAKYLAVAILTILLGVLYTGFSEWLNVSVRGSWAYSEWMPQLRLGSINIGLSPLLQWIVVPTFSFLCTRRTAAAQLLRCTQRDLS